MSLSQTNLDSPFGAKDSLKKSKSVKALFLLLILLILVAGIGFLVFYLYQNSQMPSQKVSSTQEKTDQSSQSTKQTIQANAAKLHIEINGIATDSGKIKTYLNIKNTGSENANGLTAGIYLKTHQDVIKQNLPPSLKNVDPKKMTAAQFQAIASSSGVLNSTSDEILAYKEITVPNLAPGKDTVLPIELTTPTTLKSGTYLVEAGAFDQMGIGTAIASRLVNLKGNDSFLTYYNGQCKVVVSGKEYDAQQAPLITPGQEVTGTCNFTNTTQKPITVSSYQGNYAVMWVAKYPVTEKKALTQQNSVVINPNETQKVTFKLPNLNTPQVYAATVQLMDNQNQPISPFVTLRWSVKGASAKIQSATLDNTFYGKGDPITASVLASPSLDLYFNGLGTPLKDPKLAVTVINASGQVCGSATQNLPQLDKPIYWPLQKITFNSSFECRNPKIVAQILDGTQKLADFTKEYASLASTQSNHKSQNVKIAWIALGVTLVLFVIVVVLFIKTGGFKHSKLLSLLLLGTLSLVIGFGLCGVYVDKVQACGIQSSQDSDGNYTYWWVISDCRKSPQVNVSGNVTTAPDVAYPYPATYDWRPYQDTCPFNEWRSGICDPNSSKNGYNNYDPGWGVIAPVYNFIYGFPVNSMVDNGNGTSNISFSGYNGLDNPCGNDRQEAYVSVWVDGVYQQTRGPYGWGSAGSFSDTIAIPNPTSEVDAYYWGHWVHLQDQGNGSQDGEAFTQNNVLVPQPPVPAVGPFSLTQDGTTTCAAMQVNLNWTTANNADRYDVYRNGSVIASFAASTTSYRDSAIVENQSYNYFIRAVRTSDNAHADTNTITVNTPKCTPNAPSVSAVGSCQAVNTPQVTINWTTQGGSTYDVTRDGATLPGGSSLPPGTTSLVDAPAPTGPHNYSVSATNTYGTTPGNVVSVTPPSCIQPQVSINTIIANICYTASAWSAIQPIVARITSADPASVNSVVFRVQKTVGTTTTTATYPAAKQPGDASDTLWQATIPFDPPGGFVIDAQATSVDGFTSPWSGSYSYSQNATCLPPHLETRNGGVHSNGQISD